MSIALSVRLDEETLSDLSLLEREGRTRSEAIRQAIHEAGRARRRKRKLAEEVALVMADEADRQESSEVLMFMESLDL